MCDKRLVSEKNYDEKSCVHAFDAGYNQNERLKDEHARYKLREQFLNFYCGQQGLLNHCEAPPPHPTISFMPNTWMLQCIQQIQKIQHVQCPHGGKLGNSRPVTIGQFRQGC